MDRHTDQENDLAAAYYPVHLDLNGRLCVVVGGGPVAERKIRSLLECGARVLVISPALSSGLQGLAGQGCIDVVRRKFVPDDLAGAFLVVAATDEVEVNQAVSSEATRRNLLVNVVDDPARCNFIVPSVLRRGDLVVTVSTGGRSPAVARAVRERLEGLLEPEYATLLDVVSDVRAEFKRAGIKVDAGVWQLALNEKLLDMVKQGMVDQARERMRKMLVDSRA